MTTRTILHRRCSANQCTGAVQKLGLCGNHYARQLRGKPPITKRDLFIQNNPPNGVIGLIPLTQGKVAVVDARWYPVLIHWKWHYGSGGYAVRRLPAAKEFVYMHKVIANTPVAYEADHTNCDRLDNREVNLRNCTHAQNAANQLPRRNRSSVYKGVTWHKKAKKWLAQIMVDYKNYNLGLHAREEDAAAAYNRRAVIAFGDFAKLNTLR